MNFILELNSDRYAIWFKEEFNKVFHIDVHRIAGRNKGDAVLVVVNKIITKGLIEIVLMVVWHIGNNLLVIVRPCLTLQ